MQKYSFKRADTVLKKGAKRIDSSNLTDDIAADMIKRNPNNARLFKLNEEKPKAVAPKDEKKEEQTPGQEVVKEERKSSKTKNKDKNGNA